MPMEAWFGLPLSSFQEGRATADQLSFQRMSRMACMHKSRGTKNGYSQHRSSQNHSSIQT